MARGFVQGDVERGGFTVTTDGRTSTTLVQRSFPGATVSVFNAGTAVLSTIFSDQGGTPQANPFVADTDGHWSFWANPGSYDVQFSGSGLSTFTRFAFFVPDTAVTAPLPDPGSNGILVRTGLQVLVARTLTGTANEITVTNGDGTGGNPTISLPGSLTFTGKTITGGAYLPTTISGGTHTSVTAFSIRSSGAAFDTTLAVTEVLTANRTLTITLNDISRSLIIGGNVSFANAFATTPANSITLTTTGGTNVTLPISGTLATLAGTETFTNKTLTSPRIGTALLDTNGNEVLETPATASAVNQLRVTNAATGNPVLVNAVGDDGVIGLTISTKSTGNFVVNTNGADRITQDGANQVYFGNGVTNASPTGNHILVGTGGLGANIGGTNLELSGGRGTGNAEPGEVGLRYPLRVAAGSTLQSLSTARYPLSVCMYTNTTLGTAISNSVAETSLFTGVTASPGSTRTIEAGFTKAGTNYRVRLEGDINTTGTPTLQLRFKFGSTTLNDTSALTMPTLSTCRFELIYYMEVFTIGAAASNRVSLRVQLTSGTNGIVTLTHIVRVDGVAVDLTASQTIDVTAQWGTASVNNSIQLTGVTIERLR